MVLLVEVRSVAVCGDGLDLAPIPATKDIALIWLGPDVERAVESNSDGIRARRVVAANVEGVEPGAMIDRLEAGFVGTAKGWVVEGERAEVVRLAHPSAEVCDAELRRGVRRLPYGKGFIELLAQERPVASFALNFLPRLRGPIDDLLLPATRAYDRREALALVDDARKAFDLVDQLQEGCHRQRSPSGDVLEAGAGSFFPGGDLRIAGKAGTVDLERVRVDFFQTISGSPVTGLIRSGSGTAARSTASSRAR
ncbi:hypothetical protein C7W88_00070 [Novosphingobium sp. THN1]|uniref:hypothetical protein n=1 Tax=Novosphingobium sp. THN1 TaxID=1016987 RepID=UPI000E5041A9|nr:hypothetical protein [Novosphingobium sp. THN1]AXU17816.1 hypothetical protein C7W88_00070 [Novosphingobium sp. THN1]